MIGTYVIKELGLDLQRQIRVRQIYFYIYGNFQTCMKVGNRSTRKRRDICSKLTIKPPKDVNEFILVPLIVKFEQTDNATNIFFWQLASKRPLETVSMTKKW